MSREIDRRAIAAAEPTAERKAELARLATAVSTGLPGSHQVQIERFDAATGNPAAISSAGAPAEEGDFVARAAAHLRQIGPALGLGPPGETEFEPDPAAAETTAGAMAVHFQQRHKGIPIFRAAQTVRFGPDGALRETVGTTYSVEGELDATPALSVEAAAMIAARHVAVPDDDELGETDPFGEPLRPQAVDLSGYEPTVVEAAESADRTTRLAAGPFGAPTTASLVWFPLGQRDLRLCWQFVITEPGQAGQWLTLVDAHGGDVMYCRQLASS